MGRNEDETLMPKTKKLRQGNKSCLLPIRSFGNRLLNATPCSARQGNAVNPKRASDVVGESATRVAEWRRAFSRIPFFSLRADPFGPYRILDKHANIEFVFDGDTIAHNCANPLFAEDEANPGPFVKRAMKTDTEAGRRDVKNTPSDGCPQRCHDSYLDIHRSSKFGSSIICHGYP
jgi:hypothetical protein